MLHAIFTLFAPFTHARTHPLVHTTVARDTITRGTEGAGNKDAVQKTVLDEKSEGREFGAEKGDGVRATGVEKTRLRVYIGSTG